MTNYLPGHLFVVGPQAILIACLERKDGDIELIWFQIFNNIQVRIRRSHND